MLRILKVRYYHLEGLSACNEQNQYVLQISIFHFLFVFYVSQFEVLLLIDIVG